MWIQVDATSGPNWPTARSAILINAMTGYIGSPILQISMEVLDFNGRIGGELRSKKDPKDFCKSLGLKWMLGLDGITNSVTGKWAATEGEKPRDSFQLINKSGKLERIEIGDGSG